MSEKVQTEGSFKVKKKPGRPKKLNKKEETVKVDLSKTKEDAIQEPETTKVVLQSSEQSEEKGEETKVGLQEVGESHKEEVATEESKKEEEVVVESPIVELNKKEDETIEPLVDTPKLPENIEKLVDFMKDTGGTLEDYLRLNAD